MALAVGLAFTVGGAQTASAQATTGVAAHVSLGAGAWLPTGAAMLMAKKKPKKKPAVEEDPGPRLTPDDAEVKRQAIRDSVQSSKDAGDHAAVADGLERNAAQLGDPVTMLEASEARLEAAKKDRSTRTAEAAIETARVALDMLHFYAAVNNGDTASDWLVMEPGDAGGLVDRADGVVTEAEALVEDIESEDDGAVASGPGGDKKKKRKRRDKGEKKPGTGMIAAGSILTAVGVGGVSMVIAGTVMSAARQNEVEKLTPDDPEVDELDDQGRRANLIAYVGAGVAVAGLAVGLPLIIIGAKKRKQGKGPPATATTRSSLVVAPAFGSGTAALSVRGRF